MANNTNSANQKAWLSRILRLFDDAWAVLLSADASATPVSAGYTSHVFNALEKAVSQRELSFPVQHRAIAIPNERLVCA